jgi:hypothetical protein
MQSTLISMPDCKKHRPDLTLGQMYKIKREFGNGFVIETDDGEDIIILQERFTTTINKEQ